MHVIYSHSIASFFLRSSALINIFKKWTSKVDILLESDHGKKKAYLHIDLLPSHLINQMMTSFFRIVLLKYNSKLINLHFIDICMIISLSVIHVLANHFSFLNKVQLTVNSFMTISAIFQYYYWNLFGKDNLRFEQ